MHIEAGAVWSYIYPLAPALLPLIFLPPSNCAMMRHEQRDVGCNGVDIKSAYC